MRNLWNLVGAILIFTGCHVEPERAASSHSESGVPADFDPAAISAQVASAYCQAFERCESDIRLEFLRYQPYCIQSLATVLKRDLEALSAFVQDGTIAYDSDAMAACADHIRTSSCWALETENFEEVCALPLIGTRLNGSPCTEDGECETGFCPGADGCESTCQPLSRLGESCSTDGERQCQAGLDCNAEQLCVEKTELAFRAAGGERCELVRCEPGFHCARRADQTSVCRSTESRFTLTQG